jgi:hypothetical protein
MNIFTKKQTSSEQKYLIDKKNEAFLIYFAIEPSSHFELTEKLKKAFPEIEAATQLTWINEFMSIDKIMWEFAERFKQTKYTRESFYLDFKNLFSWMNEESIEQAFSRTDYYITRKDIPADILELMNVFVTNLKSYVKNIEENNPDFEKLWQSAKDKFTSWSNRLQEKNHLINFTSSLNVKLYFLQCVVETYHNDNIRTNQEINDLIIGSEPIGRKELTLGNKVYQVVNSTVSERYRILLNMKDDKGKSVIHEYFD